ncbi:MULTISPECIES: hypothetical protein [Pseudomonas]|jgi:hypothetical protein|uniref:hypothetical protein n=1 Tax=Pseudomonas TaxID=286 RepID=UPI0009810266|nr:hypothetical protein [Pseudomonas putida]OMQ38866.1 hypothetical protein BKX96_06505 [Pseudomonas putida]
MQQSTTHSPAVTGQLIKTYHHGKGFLVFMLLFAIVMLGLAGFVLYLGTILPAGSEKGDRFILDRFSFFPK